MARQIAIIGDGWLGKPLAAHLASLGEAKVHLSFRGDDPHRPKAIEATRAHPFYLDLPRVDAAAGRLLQTVSTLVFTLPPGGRRLGEAAIPHYLSCLQAILPYVENAHFIFTSSTGVYGQGACGAVDESYPPSPDRASSRAVFAVEEMLHRRPAATSLRLAGLYGPGRDPSRFLRPREGWLEDAGRPVNLVHRDDVIQAIQLVIEGRATGTFNVCAAAHPTRLTFYGPLLAAAGTPVTGDPESGRDGKTISSDKIRQYLGWTPRHDRLQADPAGA